MDITKQDFGRFVSERRLEAGLTQRELAARLHVTESAVSKWERGLSYPDITMVQAIAAQLGVSAQELISASEDREGRADKRDARSYRNWRGAILWSTGLTWAVAILSCFIINLSVQHTLSWFWVVLPAVTLAFSVTTLPLLPVPHPGWAALVGATLSLGALALRYLPLPGLGRAAVVTLLGGVCVLVISRLVDTVLGESSPSHIDLANWNDETIDANIRLLVFAAALATALVLAVVAILRAASRRRRGEGSAQAVTTEP